jgi:hypothetical protein
MPPVEWCCAGFRSYVEYTQPGDRGVTVLFGRDSLRRLEVVVQFRSVEFAQESHLPAIPIPISLCTDVRIVFCPWCGTNVETHYARWVDQLICQGYRAGSP